MNSTVCRVVETAITCEPRAVGEARGWVREQLASLYADLQADVVDDVGLAVSELVTNCVRADAHELTVSLTVHHDELVVATTDDAPGVPRVRTPAHASPTGRGLQIVAAVTTEWGVSPNDGGKTVWGKFSAIGDPASTFECSR